MNAFYEHHQDHIRFHYRCFDRILLNGLIQPFQQSERVVGFFSTYRKQYPVSRDVLQHIATDRVLFAVGGEESDHSFRLLKRLNQSIEEDAVEATVVESDMILVVLVESVHESSPCRQKTKRITLGMLLRAHWNFFNQPGASPSTQFDPQGISRARPVAGWLEWRHPGRCLRPLPRGAHAVQ